MRVGVIGGGMMGLAAALRLRQAGHEVTLWERAPFFGGQAGTFAIAGTRLEFFYHHLFRSDTAIADLMTELGIGDALQWLPSTVGMFYDGKTFPLDGALDLLRLGYVSPIGRLRIGLATQYLQMKKRGWESYEHITAADWLGKMHGGNAFDRVMGAQLKAKFGPSWDKIPMVYMWKKIQLRTTSRENPLAKEYLGYPRGSFQVLIDALEAKLRAIGVQLHNKADVQSVTANANGGVTVRVDGEPQEFDTVLVTAPSAVFKKLVGSVPADYERQLDAASYQAACCMILEMDRKLSDTYWLNIADPTVPFTGVIEHTNFVPPEQYGGSHIIYLSKYIEVSDPVWTMDDDDLFRAYIPALKRINPTFDPSWVITKRVFRERAAQPIVPLGYSALVPDMRTPIPNVYLANTTQIYPEDRGTNYSIAYGQDAAKLMLGDLTSGRIAPRKPEAIPAD